MKTHWYSLPELRFAVLCLIFPILGLIALLAEVYEHGVPRGFRQFRWFVTNLFTSIIDEINKKYTTSKEK